MMVSKIYSKVWNTRLQNLYNEILYYLETPTKRRLIA